MNARGRPESEGANDALVGATGFVGTTLLAQTAFAHRYRSTDVETIRGRAFDTVVCAAAPAQKWIANRDPAADRGSIDRLVASLREVRCRTFVLVSTVDVFADPVGVDEDAPVDEAGLQPYGRHRLMLERFVEDAFERVLVVRLPGLVGPGLRKNVVFDLLNDNNLAAIDGRARYQFYPMVNLWYDIRKALGLGLRLLHLVAEPIDVSTLAREGFGRPFDRVLPGTPARYDLRTRHAAAFGAEGPYQYRVRDTLTAVRAYAQSEPRAGGARVP